MFQKRDTKDMNTIVYNILAETKTQKTNNSFKGKNYVDTTKASHNSNPNFRVTDIKSSIFKT